MADQNGKPLNNIISFENRNFNQNGGIWKASI